MKKIMTVIGARPQIIKAAALSRVFGAAYSTQVQELIVHTGQHYDENMSEVFFQELGVPKPFVQLANGGGSHGTQTGNMLVALEQLLLEHRPDAVIVYGDTNSTLAGALAASKLQIPVVHVEAGLRSYRKAMPEEMNRIVADHAATLLFSPTEQGIENLRREGFSMEKTNRKATADAPKVLHCGDIMYDNSLFFSEQAAEQSTILETLDCANAPFILATVHRNTNTDIPERLRAIVTALMELAAARRQLIVLPLHPRTRNCLAQEGTVLQELEAAPFIRLAEPVGFLDMIRLEQQASLVITDSGGVQKEAYFFRKPCIVLREETEWVELVETGAATLAGADKTRIVEAANRYLEQPPVDFPPIFGTGDAASFICRTIVEELF